MTQIATLMAALTPNEGINTTAVDGIELFKCSQYGSRGPLCYSQGILIVGQGKKRIYLDNKTFDYDPSNSLVMTVPMPVECETFASEDEPVLVMIVNINHEQLNHIIRLMEQHNRIPKDLNTAEQAGFFVASTTDEMSETVTRLLHALQSPLDAKVLGQSLVLELLYCLLKCDNAAPLYALALSHTRLSRIDKALRFIHQQYSHTIEVDQLAQLVNMSPSAFHRCFKEVTSSSPIQYLKKIRLNKAKELLQSRSYKVKEVAVAVGYESSAQFSREFKRYFTQSPGECARQ